MERTLLFTTKTDEIKVTIEAFFDDTENLVIEGYDIGKTVEAYWGDSDYEYSLTITSEEVTKLYLLFHLIPGNKHELLSYLQAHYNTNTCYSNIRDLLTKHKINYESFSWN